MKHKVVDIRGTKNEGSEDSDIFQIAQKHNAIFLTTDKDFFHTVPYLYKKHYGVIIITLRQPNRNNILKRLKWALGHINLHPFKNKVLLLRDNTYIIYGK